MEWIKEIEFEDLLEKDAKLIYDHCGIETLVSLWTHLPGITLYLSERTLFAMKARFIRNHCRKDDPDRDVKALAALLKVSEKFVYEALATTEEKDDRQERLL